MYANLPTAWRALMRAGTGPAAFIPYLVLEAEKSPSNQKTGGAQQTRTPILAAVEAALFASSSPMTLAKLVRLADLEDASAARAAIRELNGVLDSEDSPLRIEEIAGGVQMLTRREFTPWLRRFANHQSESNLSPPALEVLAIIAYRQPICRADVEAVRGVQIAEILKQLLDRGLIRLCGRDESLGRPFRYGTTRKFLEVFGLRSLRELPLNDLLNPPTGESASSSELQ